MNFFSSRPVFFAFWIVGLLYQFAAPLICKKMSPDGEMATLVIGVLLASSFGDVALNSSLLRDKKKIRNLLATRVVLYCIFIVTYSYVFNVNLIYFAGGAIASPALFSFLYARGIRSHLRVSLFFRILAIIFLALGYPVFSLIFYSGTAMSVYILAIICFKYDLKSIRAKIVRPLVPRPLFGEFALTFFSSFISGYVSTSTLVEVILERAYRLLLGAAGILGDLIFYKTSLLRLKNKAHLYSSSSVGVSVFLIGIFFLLISRVTHVIVFLLPVMGVLTSLMGKFVILPMYGYARVISVVVFVHVISLVFLFSTNMMGSPILLLISIELGIFIIYGLLLMGAIKVRFGIQ